MIEKPPQKKKNSMPRKSDDGPPLEAGVDSYESNGLE